MIHLTETQVNLANRAYNEGLCAYSQYGNGTDEGECHNGYMNDMKDPIEPEHDFNWVVTLLKPYFPMKSDMTVEQYQNLLKDLRVAEYWLQRIIGADWAHEWTHKTLGDEHVLYEIPLGSDFMDYMDILILAILNDEEILKYEEEGGWCF